MNWDAALNEEEGLLGIEGILRDCNGQVIGTIQAKRRLKLSAYNGEAYAMMMSSIFFKELCVTKFILEGDAMQVVNLLNTPQTNWNYGGLLIKDAKQLISTFVEWTVVHTKREGNTAAHLLAQNAFLISEDLYELEEDPLCVQHVVNNELL
ncbi:hypothetical protein F2P56_007604 [Juglans regia]|uniref:RNase H type-1 domain-containing protein n=1 Tax=Juglans regia TaxID=51240 RepID=A0A834D3F2_JUGRE|nr:hypothetical protein F2P56_007604 [Juglans regia]